MGKLYLAILSMAFKDSSDREIRWSSKVFTIFLVLAVVGRTETMRILEKYNNNFPDTLILLQLIESTFVAPSPLHIKAALTTYPKHLGIPRRLQVVGRQICIPSVTEDCSFVTWMLKTFFAFLTTWKVFKKPTTFSFIISSSSSSAMHSIDHIKCW